VCVDCAGGVSERALFSVSKIGGDRAGIVPKHFRNVTLNCVYSYPVEDYRFSACIMVTLYSSVDKLPIPSGVKRPAPDGLVTEYC